MGNEGPAMQIKVKFCTCGVGSLIDDNRIHDIQDMYQFVVTAMQSVVYNFGKCGLRDLMIVLATALPKEATQHHIWCETAPKDPADARYNMYVEVHSDDPSLYPNITLADFDKQPDIMDMLRGLGARVYTIDEEGGTYRIV